MGRRAARGCGVPGSPWSPWWSIGPSISSSTSTRTVDLEIGRDADDVAVERGVMQLAAARRAVGDHRLAQRMAVGQDVRRLQQLVDGAADRWRSTAGRRRITRCAKAALVQPLAHHRGDVLPPRGERRRVARTARPLGAPTWASIGHDEGEGLGAVVDDEHGPRRLVEPRDDAVKIDERRLRAAWRAAAPRCPDAPGRLPR